MALPKGFTDLVTAYNSPRDTFTDVIGVVVDVRPPTSTRTGEHMITFKLLDQSLRDACYGSQGLTVRFFKKDIDSLPQVRDRGDIVLLRQIKISSFHAQPMALSNYQTAVLVFPAASIPDPKYQIAYQDKKRLDCLGTPRDKEKFTLAEQSCIIQLKQDMGPNVNDLGPPVEAPTGPAPMRAQVPPNQPTTMLDPVTTRKRPGEDSPATASKKTKTSSFSYKFKLIRDVQHRVFADICGQVVKQFPTSRGCELYVTDYTENKEMFNYAPPEEKSNGRDGDEYGYNESAKKEWPGPYGSLVLKVNLMSPHAEYANRGVREKDFVLLRNVKMKAMGDRTGRLEGDMWHDNLNPEEVKVSHIRDMLLPEIVALQERKERYWAARNAKTAANNHQEEKKPLTKTEKKKQKKERKLEQANANNSNRPKNDLNNKSKADTNPHIRCGHEEVPPTPIKAILDPTNKRHANTLPGGETSYTLPFLNAKFRARVRVVDFTPKNLEDFSVPYDSSFSPSSSQDDDNGGWESSLKHEWSFSLLLEDADAPQDRLWANLGHSEAQYLFGNAVEDPRDLREDGRLLAKVREKLWTLWGNLEEERGEGVGVSNRVFECCLMEYGIPCDEDEGEGEGFGYRRLWRMFGVTIL